MTYAIIETGGKQLWVEPGRFYDVELLEGGSDTEIDLRTVLLINHEGAVTLGHPYVAEAVVKGRILRTHRGRKVIVYKMKPKKKTRKKKGHRQSYSRLLIESIQLNGTVLASGSLDDVIAIEAVESRRLGLGSEPQTPMQEDLALATDMSADSTHNVSTDDLAVMTETTSDAQKSTEAAPAQESTEAAPAQEAPADSSSDIAPKSLEVTAEIPSDPPTSTAETPVTETLIDPQSPTVEA